MSRINFCPRLSQGCVFLSCGGTRITSTTEEVRSPALSSHGRPSFLFVALCGFLSNLCSLNLLGSRRMALFCMMHLGSEVFDTEMVVVDRSVTDVCFEGVTILLVFFFFSFIKNIYYCKCFVFKCNFHSKSRRSAFV